jgi:hypothetical protein
VSNEQFFHQRFGLRPVAKGELLSLESECSEVEKKEYWAVHIYFLFGMIVASVMCLFSDHPQLIFLPVFAFGGYLLLSYRVGMDSARASFNNAVSPLSAERLPAQILDLCEQRLELKGEILKLMKEQGGFLFGYQVNVFQLRLKDLQRQSIQDELESFQDES